MAMVEQLVGGGYRITLTDQEGTALRDAADGDFSLPDHASLSDLVDELKAQISPSPEPVRA